MITLNIMDKTLEDYDYNYMEVADSETDVKCFGDVVILNVNGAKIGLDVSNKEQIRLFSYNQDCKLSLVDSVSDTVEVNIK